MVTRDRGQRVCEVTEFPQVLCSRMILKGLSNWFCNPRGTISHFNFTKFLTPTSSIRGPLLNKCSSSHRECSSIRYWMNSLLGQVGSFQTWITPGLSTSHPVNLMQNLRSADNFAFGSERDPIRVNIAWRLSLWVFLDTFIASFIDLWSCLRSLRSNSKWAAQSIESIPKVKQGRGINYLSFYMRHVTHCPLILKTWESCVAVIYETLGVHLLCHEEQLGEEDSPPTMISRNFTYALLLLHSW